MYLCKYYLIVCQLCLLFGTSECVFSLHPTPALDPTSPSTSPEDEVHAAVRVDNLAELPGLQGVRCLLCGPCEKRSVIGRMTQCGVGRAAASTRQGRDRRKRDLAGMIAQHPPERLLDPEHSPSSARSPSFTALPLPAPSRSTHLERLLHLALSKPPQIPALGVARAVALLLRELGECARELGGGEGAQGRKVPLEDGDGVGFGGGDVGLVGGSTAGAGAEGGNERSRPGSVCWSSHHPHDEVDPHSSSSAHACSPHA